MLRCLIFLMCAGFTSAAVLPEKFGKWRIAGRPSAVTLPDESLWKEYGLEEAQSAEYRAAGARLRITGYRMTDPTGGLAAFQALRPEGARAVKTGVGVSTASGSLLLFGNYVLDVDDTVNEAALKDLRAALPNLDRSSLPSLPQQLPVTGKISGSERYVLGPQSLSRVAQEISPEQAGFHTGAEAQFARYRRNGEEYRYLLFSYPTPQIARRQAELFSRGAGLVAHRAGPLVAVVPGDPGNATVKQLAESLVYSTSLMWNEQPPKPQGNPGEMIYAIMILAVVLIATSVLFGFLFGGVRVVLRRFGIRVADEHLTSLNIGFK